MTFLIHLVALVFIAFLFYVGAFYAGASAYVSRYPDADADKGAAGKATLLSIGSFIIALLSILFIFIVK